MSDVSGERWQTRIKSLREGIQHIYKTKDFFDVVIKVRNGNKSFKAHRLVLAARSSEFGRILLSPNADALEDVIVDDESVTETGLEILLRFIYLDTLGTDDKSSIVEAYSAAVAYQQIALKIKCEDMMESWDVGLQEVCVLLNVSLKIPMLKERCLNFIRANANDVITSPEFYNLNFNSLIEILENKALDNIPVLQRLERIIEWGGNRHTKPVDYKLVREDFLSSTPPLLGMLKLETLSPDDLATVVASYQDLLTPTEVLNFMMYYRTNNALILPSWNMAS